MDPLAWWHLYVGDRAPEVLGKCCVQLMFLIPGSRQEYVKRIHVVTVTFLG